MRSLAMAHAALFGAAAWLAHSLGAGGRRGPAGSAARQVVPKAAPVAPRLLASMALADGLSCAALLVAVREVGSGGAAAPAVAVHVALGLLLTMLLSALLLRPGYSPMGWTGAAVVALGTVRIAGGSPSGVCPLWLGVALTGSAALVAKESLMKQPGAPSLLALAAAASAGQLAAVQLLHPAWLHAAAPGLIGAAACAAAAGATRLAQLWALRVSSAVAVQLANALALLLGPALALWPFVPGQLLECTAVTGVGLALFAAARVRSAARRRRAGVYDPKEARALYQDLGRLEDQLKEKLRLVKEATRKRQEATTSGDERRRGALRRWRAWPAGAFWRAGPAGAR